MLGWVLRSTQTQVVCHCSEIPVTVNTHWWLKLQEHTSLRPESEIQEWWDLVPLEFLGMIFSGSSSFMAPGVPGLVAILYLQDRKGLIIYYIVPVSSFGGLCPDI